MIKGTYVRPGPRELRGETALLREKDGQYLAQFDNLNAFSRHETDWAFGWHWFTTDSFEIQETDDDA